MNAYPPEIQSLFDQSAKFDKQKIAILDEVSSLMTSSDSQKMMLASAVWKDLKEKTEFWINGDVVLELSNNHTTKVLTLVLMEETIKLKWLALPEQAREGLKNYMVNYVFKTSQAGNLNQQQITVLSKCNSIIIKILTFEWNSTWKSFIPDICSASRTDPNICENSLHLLKMLSEEIFEHSKNELTSVQVKQLKETMHEQFKHIYDLCYFIASGTLQNMNACKPSLIRACLETFHAYLSWIPLAFVIETDIVDIFLYFTAHDALKDAAIQCLMEVALLKVEIGGTPEDTLKMKNKMMDLYFKFISKLSESILPFNINLSYERKRLQQLRMNQDIARFESLCSRVALFLTSFFSTHLEWIEELTNDFSNANRGNLVLSISRGLQYIVNINEIEEENIFKICIEFWHQFTCEQLRKQIARQLQIAQQQQNHNGGASGFNVLRLNNTVQVQQQENPANQPIHKTVYPQILTQIRVIISSRMAKPVEVLIVIEDGVPVREDLTDTENNSLYDLLKEILTNLSKLDWQDMSRILLAKLEKQLDGTEWSFDNLNSLCWAIGSISGSVKNEEERTLLIQVIKGLLTLTEQKKQKESKAVVASNIMYVVSQYPIFLKNNWSFLKTVVKKLFEFMNETFPGVMEMAVNTFLTVCKKCAEEFVKPQQEKTQLSKTQSKTIEAEPYILGLIRQIDEKSAVLELQCKLTFYEAIGHIINAEKDPSKSQVYLESALRSHLDQWKQIILNAQVNPTLLMQVDVTASISLFLRIADRICSSVGYNFIFIIGQISLGMNEIYKYYSQNINSEIQIDARRLNHVQIKKMRLVKKEVIKLYVCFFQWCKKSQPLFQPQTIVVNLIEPLQQLLVDYVNCVDACRESELLALYQVIFENMAEYIQPLIPDTLQGIFMSTLSMITLDFSSFPEHRLGFFRLLKAVVQNAIEALFNIPSESFKTMIDCIVWAFKHHLPEISDIGLDVLVYIMRKVNTNQLIANQFYKLYYANLLKDVLEVLTDGCHKSGFKQQCIIFQMLIAIVKQGFIQESLFEGQTTDNATYVYEYLVKVLANTFNNVSQQKTQSHMENLFTKVENLHLFKVELRDYLINLTMYTNDNAHLFDAQEGGDQQAPAQQMQQQQQQQHTGF